MFNVFDRLVAQSFGGDFSAGGKSPVAGGAQGGQDMIQMALQKVRGQGQKDPKQALQSGQKDVSDIYKQHNLALAARGEGPWAQQMSAGQVPDGAKLGQNDAMNYHIMRRTYMDAKAEADKQDSMDAEREWKDHMAQKYGMQGSIPGEGN
jgi:hypothetical protein